MKIIPASLLLLLVFVTPQALAKEGTYADNWSISYHRSEANDTTQIDLAAEETISRYTKARAGLSYIRADNDYNYYGLGMAVRAELPWSVTPFVGSGIFFEVFSNDIDNMVYLTAIYPEAGIHLWLGDSVRLSASSRYYISSWGRDSDRRIDGIELSFTFD